MSKQAAGCLRDILGNVEEFWDLREFAEVMGWILRGRI